MAASKLKQGSFDAAWCTQLEGTTLVDIWKYWWPEAVFSSTMMTFIKTVSREAVICIFYLYYDELCRGREDIAGIIQARVIEFRSPGFISVSCQSTEHSRMSILRGFEFVSKEKYSPFFFEA